MKLKTLQFMSFLIDDSIEWCGVEELLLMKFPLFWLFSSIVIVLLLNIMQYSPSDAYLVGPMQMNHQSAMKKVGLSSSSFSRRFLKVIRDRNKLQLSAFQGLTNPEDIHQYKMRFTNIARLYQNESVLETFHNAHICVIGLGGVGSWVVEALARNGIGRFTLIDMDEICLSNFNRQVMAVLSSIGKFKTETLKKRILEINPFASVTLINDFINSENVRKYLDQSPLEQQKRKFDYVIDCIDSVKNKAEIISTCVQLSLPIITSGRVGGLSDLSKLKIEDLNVAEGDKMLFRLRRKLKEDHSFPISLTHKKNKKKKWNILTGYSSEQPLLVDKEEEEGQSKTFSSFRPCDTTFGNSCFLSGSLGFLIAGEVINRLARNDILYPTVRPHHQHPLLQQKTHFISSMMTSEDNKTTTADNNKIESSHEQQEQEEQAHPINCSCCLSDYCQPTTDNNDNSSTHLPLLEKITALPDYSSLTATLTDAHCHLQLSPIYEQTEQILPICREQNLSHIAIAGTCPGEDWRRVQSLCEKYNLASSKKVEKDDENDQLPFIIPAYGLHPWWIERFEKSVRETAEDVMKSDNKNAVTVKKVQEETNSDDGNVPGREKQANTTFDKKEMDIYLQSLLPPLRQLLESNPFVGVGECGLDKNIIKQSPSSTLEKQLFYLQQHILLACEYHRPLILHGVTGCWGHLHQCLMKTLSPYKEEQKGKSVGQGLLRSIVLHSCQSLPVDMLSAFENLSKLYCGGHLYYSISGNAFNKQPTQQKDDTSEQTQMMNKKIVNLLQNIPIDKLLIESDSPDQLPTAFRSQLPQSCYNLPLIVKYNCLELSKCLQMEVNSLATIITENTKRAYGLRR
jgi:tRNA A37 threonylcarbamoyladenosine dehydratase/Tat protein secretion system quality control protein TatD with DNase activity